MDEDLLGLVNYLVEYPVPVLCGFDREYLKLPKELLITVMKDHQKYFGIQDGGGSLLNQFIVISNTLAENGEIVRTGAEKVIKARFDDAKFYYYEDMKKPLNDRIGDLKKVTFHDKLGSLYDKTGRISSMGSPRPIRSLNSEVLARSRSSASGLILSSSWLILSTRG